MISKATAVIWKNGTEAFELLNLLEKNSLSDEMYQEEIHWSQGKPEIWAQQNQNELFYPIISVFVLECGTVF